MFWTGRPTSSPAQPCFISASEKIEILMQRRVRSEARVETGVSWAGCDLMWRGLACASMGDHFPHQERSILTLLLCLSSVVIGSFRLFFVTTSTIDINYLSLSLVYCHLSFNLVNVVAGVVVFIWVQQGAGFSRKYDSMTWKTTFKLMFLTKFLCASEQGN